MPKLRPKQLVSGGNGCCPAFRERRSSYRWSDRSYGSACLRELRLCSLSRCSAHRTHRAKPAFPYLVNQLNYDACHAMSPLIQLEHLKEALLDLVFPPHCVGCGGGGSFLCPSCCVSLPHLTPPLCPKCGLPLARGGPCPACARTPLSIEGIRSPFLMEGLVRECVHHLKYRNLRALARPLGRLLADYLESSPLPADALVPVPLHRRRLRERGYNQAALLAREVARGTGLSLVDGSLVRRRDTPAQARSGSAAERRGNVEGAFACRDGRLKGKRVLLIDDVCTTGATLDACARALKEAGALSAWGLTLAREP